jgi:hypothetical protein
MQALARVRRRWAIAAAGAAALVAAGAVAAAETEKVHLTAEGQAAARAAVLQKADFAGAAGWTGGLRKADASDDGPLCAGFSPDDSYMTVNGQAESVWKHPAGLEFESHADVLQTPAMVARDWRETVLSPKFFPCIRTLLMNGLAAEKGVQFVSLRRIAFPTVTTMARRYRALIDVRPSSTKIRMMADIVIVGRGRTEMILMTIAPYAAAPVVGAAEERIAFLLAARCRT